MIKCPVCGSREHHAIVERTWGEGWTRLFLANTDNPVTLHVCLSCGVVYIPADYLKEVKQC